MFRLKTVSIALLILLPLLSLIYSLSTGSLGFFIYSLAGTVAPGLTGLLMHYFGQMTVKT
ncbi:MAG: hypothetical protein WCC10_04070 [Tumebacillaceae bacterium]